MELNNSDVVKDRQKRLEGLRSRIQLAFDNRVQQTHIEEIKNTKEAVEKNRALGQTLLQVTDDTLLNMGEFVEAPNQVTVDNPHDYGDLLTLSLQKLADEGYFYSKEIGRTKDKILEHEFEHHVPALDQPGLKIKYSVFFIKDEAKNFVGISPSITLSGITSVRIFLEYLKISPVRPKIRQLRTKPNLGEKTKLILSLFFLPHPIPV